MENPVEKWMKWARPLTFYGNLHLEKVWLRNPAPSWLKAYEEWDKRSTGAGLLPSTAHKYEL